MNHPLRLALMGLFIALLLFFAIVFPFFVFENFVRPVAIVLWVFWQILLSFDQRVVWGICIFLAASFAIFRLGHIVSPGVEQTTHVASNAAMDRVKYWQTSISYTTDEIEKPNFLKRDLEQMLVSVTALRQPDATRLEINKALKLRQIPLPESVYAFLYPDEQLPSRRSLRHMARSLWQFWVRWMRRRTGKDVADYYQSIDDVLTWMETTLEIKHDDGKFDSHNH